MELIEIKRQFIQLRAKGYSFDKIAKELGKAKQTLIDWSKEFQEEIANVKASELESLYETYHLQRENRLQIFGELLLKLKAEALKRDFSEIPAEKLLELLLKYNSQVREDYIEPRFTTSQEIAEELSERRLLEELTATTETKSRLIDYQNNN